MDGNAPKRQPYIPAALERLEGAVATICEMIFNLAGILELPQPPQTGVASEQKEAPVTILTKRQKFIDELTLRLLLAKEELIRITEEVRDY